MGKPSNIEWCDDTVNPTSGCQGCELWPSSGGGPCYAGNLHETRLAKSLPGLYAPSFNQVRLIPGRMRRSARCMDLTGQPRADKPWLDGLRRKIFVDDLADLFSRAVPLDYIESEVIETIRSDYGRRHDWLLLTKQPQRAAQFATRLDRWPDNAWIGTSITGAASRTRIGHLKRIPALHRYLSVEPLVADPAIQDDDLAGVDWMIVGGESDQGRYAGRPFQLEWARKLLQQCQRLGIAAFIKQLGSCPTHRAEALHLSDRHGGDWSEWPADLRVRQMPDAMSP